ncbi:MAG: L-seryl-tRNA(Sec) selenium transferase [Burkholderiales bacterium]|nr:L-seryl-tRNA(Sec) selenium transferase [Burkholderiales bacterium]
MTGVVPEARARLPSIDRLLAAPEALALIERHGRTAVVEAVRAAVDEARARLAAGAGAGAADAGSGLLERAAAIIEARLRPSLRPVFNLTGTVLHTNLGRALLPQPAIEAAAGAMGRPVNLEYDIDGAGRGERDSHVEAWLARLTGAEAAVAVNNNAAAVYLVLNTLARRREVVVSRGELVEIGGSFRIPDIMAAAGCRLVEVGTTNRTHARDVEGAIGKSTAAIMKVHASNYAITGFTAAVPEAELAALAHRHGLPLVNDLGCGMLVDLEDYGLPHEPTAREAIAAGADLVTFSGDKLLGGPQCGLIVGRADLVARIRRNPMKRALRLDKIRLAALEAVLRLYADPERLPSTLPTLGFLTRPRAELRALAERVAPPLAAALAGRAEVRVVDCDSQIGSGALPVATLPSAGLALTPAGKRRSGAADALARALRALPVPVVGHIRDGAVILDLRCLDRADEFVAQLDRLRFAGNAS